MGRLPRSPHSLPTFIRLTLLLVLAIASITAGRAQDDPVVGIVTFTNTARESAGVAPLTTNPALTEAAQAHAQWMATTGCFDHVCPGEPELRERVESAGYTGWSGIAENIFYGPSTPEAAVTGWLDSPGHRRNLLNPQYREIGVGLTFDENGRPYWVQVFGARRAPAR